MQLGILQVYRDKFRFDDYQEQYFIWNDADSDKFAEQIEKQMESYIYNPKLNVVGKMTSNSEVFNTQYSNITVLNSILSEPNNGVKNLKQDSDTVFFKDKKGELHRIDVVVDYLDIDDQYIKEVGSKLNICGTTLYLLLDYKTKKVMLFGKGQENEVKQAFSKGTNKEDPDLMIFPAFSDQVKLKQQHHIKSHLTITKIRKVGKRSDKKDSIARCLIKLEM